MRLPLIALALSLAAATPATAEKLDLAKLKCSEFLKSGPENIGAVMMWLLGHYHSEDDGLVIDFDQLKASGEKLGKHCAENPDESLGDAAEKLLAE